MTSAEASPDHTSAQDIFLEAFRRHSAGVSIVTLRKADGSPTGFTATSVASLSADPPLVTFNMSTSASSWPAIASSEHLLIHILGQGNHRLAQKFSDFAEARFLGVGETDGPHGLPLLPGVPAYLVGKIIDRVEHHGAATVIVEVVDGGIGSPDQGLTYQGRSYRVARPLEA